MLAVGDAAHPLQVSSVVQIFELEGLKMLFQPVRLQTCAMAIKDGAFLAKLFSHLLSEDQNPIISLRFPGPLV
jgi:hypothetical protein